MKRLFILTLLISTAFSGLFAQTEKEIKAGIKHVTVFPDRAQIDHEGTISLLPGKTTLKLPELSPFIDPQSIMVKGFGEFTVLSVNHQNNYLQNLVDNVDTENIRKQIDALQLKMEDEQAAINVLKEKAAFLNANRAVLLKETTISAENFKSIMDLYTNNIEQVTLSTLKKERLIKEYQKQITALQQQISSRVVKEQLPSGVISVTVASEKQISGKLTLSYVVTNAGWYPSYDIRVDDIRNPVMISYKANVFQNSGTPWNDVKLSFSNATPLVSGDVPVLYPWFIDFYTQPMPILRGRTANKRMSDAPAAMQEAMTEAPIVSEEFARAASPEVQKQVGETTITFDIAVPYTIPSNGSVQTVEIQRLDAPADYRYLTLPKVARFAYLTANITDWAKLSLQSGEATLYFENSFVGKSYLNVTQLTDTLTLSLGNDNSILVKREKRQDFTSTKFIGGNKTETYSFLLTIRNNKLNPVKITVKDQIPVSSNSGIIVDPVELTGGKHNSQTGEISWDLDIKPSETRQLILTYSVKYPKDKKVILE